MTDREKALALVISDLQYIHNCAIYRRNEKEVSDISSKYFNVLKAMQSSLSDGVEEVTVEELVAIMSERLSDGYHDDALFYAQRFPHGLKIVKKKD